LGSLPLLPREGPPGPDRTVRRLARFPGRAPLGVPGLRSATNTQGRRGSVATGDTIKAAVTDAIKRCAHQLGVGLHLYSPDGSYRSFESAETAEGNGEDARGRTLLPRFFSRKERRDARWSRRFRT
jgi:hypothetical protein